MRPQNKHLRPFQKGQSGNPGGKPKQLLTKDKVKSVLGKFSEMTRGDLQKIIENPESQMLAVMVASIMLKAVETGDFSRVNFILDRAIGKASPDDLESLLNTGEAISITPANIAELCKAARDG